LTTTTTRRSLVPRDRYLGVDRSYHYITRFESVYTHRRRSEGDFIASYVCKRTRNKHRDNHFNSIQLNSNTLRDSSQSDWSPHAYGVYRNNRIVYKLWHSGTLPPHASIGAYSTAQQALNELKYGTQVRPPTTLGGIGGGTSSRISLTTRNQAESQTNEQTNERTRC